MMGTETRIRKFIYAPKHHPNEHLGIYAEMYLDDFSSSLIPFRHPNFKVSVFPESQRAFVTELFARRHYRSASAEEAMQSFLSEIARMLIKNDRAMYEICRFEDNDKRLVLDLLNPKSIRIEGTKVIQEVSATRSYSAHSYEGTIDQVFDLSAPKWAENGIGFAKVVDVLKLESRRSDAPMKLMLNERAESNNHFEFTVYKEQQAKRILSLTKGSGWDVRQIFNNKLSEFYWVTRKLQFKKHQARLREYILEGINLLLVPKIQKHGIPLERIEFDGIPTSDEYEQKITELKHGKIGFLEALDLPQD